jgi:hypothetical protein
MTGVGAKQATCQTFMTAWKSANAVIQIRRSMHAERQLCGGVGNERCLPASAVGLQAATGSNRLTTDILVSWPVDLVGETSHRTNPVTDIL